MRIVECKTNHLVRPIGYQMEKPVFSYMIIESTGKKQTKARIRVSGDSQMKDILYDSGFSEDIDHLAFEADCMLEPRTRYYWDVTAWTDAGEEAVSEVTWFETGKREEPWQASWITCDGEEEYHPVFAKDMSIDGEIRKARLYICGLGLYEAYLNGNKISKEYLAPYCNDYHQWLQYQTYDITEEIQSGGRLQVLLGNGWYKGRFGFSSKLNKKPYYSNTWKLIAEIRLEYADGTAVCIGTDDTWEVTDSHITSSNIYDGEVWNRKEGRRGIRMARICTEQMAPLLERLSTPVMVREEIDPVELIHTPAGEQVLDIGQNIGGIFRMRVKEPEGTVIRLQFGEILQEGNFYRGNLRSAKAEFVYVSDGKECVLEPHFTYYGYRYVNVEGVAQLKKEDFTALVLYSELPKTGTLTTGHELVNRLIQNTEWGLKGNFIDVPTDCPQRDERMGWTGDAQVFSPTAMFLRDSYAFYKKYLFDMWQEQKEHGGQVPNVIPSVGNKGTSSVWGDAACIIPWNMYLFYGDKSILKEQFDSMKAWVDYIERVDGNDCGWRREFHFGDWLALDNPVGGSDQSMGATDTGFIASLYYANSARITSKTAEILGKQEEALHYGKLAESVLESVRKEYFSQTGRCCINTQTALLLALHFDLLQSKERTKNMLIQKLEETGYRLQTGFVGTPLLCNQLSKEGFGKIAYKLLLNEEYPGWLYEVKLGATTIWERWNSVLPDGSISSTGMNSLNHYAYGAVVEWIFRHGAGLNPLEESPGFRKVRIEPELSWNLRYLDAECRTPAGTYKISWKILDKWKAEVKITVPFGCYAELKLPLFPEEKEKQEKNPVFADFRDDICHLQPGTYSVAYKTKESIRHTYSSYDKLYELMENPKTRQTLKQEIPWIQKIPTYEWNKSIRQSVDRYGGETTKEDLKQLDQILENME